MAPLNDFEKGSQPSSTSPYPTDGMRDDLYGKGLVPTHPDVAQSGSARALGAWSRRFESCRPDHYIVASLNSMTRDFDSRIVGAIPTATASNRPIAVVIELFMDSGIWNRKEVFGALCRHCLLRKCWAAAL